jgi:hypothetical protein
LDKFAEAENGVSGLTILPIVAVGAVKLWSLEEEELR